MSPLKLKSLLAAALLLTGVAVQANQAEGEAQATTQAQGMTMPANPFDPMAWMGMAGYPAQDTATPAGITFNAAHPSAWMKWVDPKSHIQTHMQFTNPANYMQFMQPAFYMEFMKPQNMMAWFDPASYQVMMDPQTMTYWMNPNSYMHAMDPAMYQQAMNPANYMAFMNPAAYMGMVPGMAPGACGSDELAAGTCAN